MTACLCEVVTPDVTRLRRCDFADHHKYWLGDKHLPSVTQILQACFPDEYADVPSARVEHARERGVIVDALISAYVIGKELIIPVGSPNDPALHEESVALFYKFAEWWSKQGFKDVRSQVMIHDGEVAGTIDILADETVIDVKTVYRLMKPHPIQVGGYSTISGGGDMLLVHLTERYDEPKIKEVPESARDDWRTVRNFWRLKRRLIA